MSACGGESDFNRKAARGLKSLLPLKSIGIPGFMVIFFVGYFATLKHPIFSVRLMPEGPLDRIIGFQPWAIWVYCTLWLYVVLPPALLVKRSALIRYGLVAAAVAAVGLGVFLIWPTEVAPQGSGFLKAVDRGGNACPSLHVAYAVLTAFSLRRVLSRLGAPRVAGAANLLWCGAILYSTLATKQHVSADLVAGFALGAIAAPFALRTGED